jgi:hypothetical protein
VKRFPAIALGVLIAATIGAFFVIQHLKVTTPFLAGIPNPAPDVIDPYGASCQGVSHKTTRISFYLLDRSDYVDMYIVNANGDIVDQVASNRYMPKLTATNSKTVRRTFYWNGRDANGSIAPDGTYYFRVVLHQQGRYLDIGRAIHVATKVPRPLVHTVSPQIAPPAPVTVRFSGAAALGSRLLLYRTDLPGKPRLVATFPTSHRHTTTWNGLINGSPAPAGTYLVGLETTDRACNVGRFPVVVPPPPGTTPHAGITVRYLAAQPPLDPVAAGSRAPVYVDSRGRPYRWRLFVAGAPKVLAHGTGAAPGSPLEVAVPAKVGPSLYELAITSGAQKTIVPLVASAPKNAPRTRILVVLPALTWQGLNPVDDVGPSPYDGDGLPNTLTAGVPIQVNRVFADGLPAGIPDEASLLAYLRKAHLRYDLTTDLGLIDGVGPVLNAYSGVVLAGSERWLPQSLSAGLETYVQQGGSVLSLGIDSLRRTVTIRAGRALNPTGPAPFDAFGARPGPLVTGSSALITVIHDGLGIFTGTSGAFPGYSSFQPFTAVQVPHGPASLAGTTPAVPSIIGYRLGRGTVINVGLVGFGSSLAHNVNSQQFVGRLWQVLGR